MPSASGLTALLVEDEELVRNYITHILVQAGFSVLGADSHARALELFLNERVDFVVADWRLPDPESTLYLELEATEQGEVFVYAFVLVGGALLQRFQRLDRLCRHVEHPFHPGQRKGVGLVGNGDDQAAQYGQGQRELQLERSPAPRFRIGLDGAPDALHGVLYDIQADPAPGNLRDSWTQREIRQKQEVKEFRLAQFPGQVGRHHAPPDHLGANRLAIDAAPIMLRDRPMVLKA